MLLLFLIISYILSNFDHSLSFLLASIAKYDSCPATYHRLCILAVKRGLITWSGFAELPCGVIIPPWASVSSCL